MATINIKNIEVNSQGQSLAAANILTDDQAETVQGGLLAVTGCFEMFRRCDPPRFPIDPIGPISDRAPVWIP